MKVQFATFSFFSFFTYILSQLHLVYQKPDRLDGLFRNNFLLFRLFFDLQKTTDKDPFCGICTKGPEMNKRGLPEKLIHCSQCQNSGKRIIWMNCKSFHNLLWKVFFKAKVGLQPDLRIFSYTQLWVKDIINFDNIVFFFLQVTFSWKWN